MGVVALVVWPRTGLLYHLLCLENVFKYFQYFVMGLFFKKYNVFVVELLKKEYVKLILVVSFIIMYIAICTDKLGSGLLYQMVHDEAIRYVGVLMVYAFFLHISDKINTESRITRTFSYIGKHTLDIYLLHYFFLPNLIVLKPFLENNQQPLLELLTYSVTAAIVIALCLGIQYVLSMSTILQYWLFGKKVR